MNPCCSVGQAFRKANGPALKIRTSPFHDSITERSPSEDRRHSIVTKSLLFDWWRRSVLGGSWGGNCCSGGAATAGATSGTRSCGLAAGLRSAAATDLGWLAATDLGWTTAATGFGGSTNAQHDGDCSSSSKTKHTAHSELPQILRQRHQTGYRPSVCQPPAAALSLVVLREEYIGRLGELLQVSHPRWLQNIDGILLVK